MHHFTTKKFTIMTKKSCKTSLGLAERHVANSSPSEPPFPHENTQNCSRIDSSRNLHSLPQQQRCCQTTPSCLKSYDCLILNWMKTQIQRLSLWTNNTQGNCAPIYTHKVWVPHGRLGMKLISLQVTL